MDFVVMEVDEMMDAIAQIWADMKLTKLTEYFAAKKNINNNNCFPTGSAFKAITIIIYGDKVPSFPCAASAFHSPANSALPLSCAFASAPASHNAGPVICAPPTRSAPNHLMFEHLCWKSKHKQRTVDLITILHGHLTHGRKCNRRRRKKLRN